MLKICLVTLLLWPVHALGDRQTTPETPRTEHATTQEPVKDEENADGEPATWVDASHAYASDRVQALTIWMDNFFGDPTYDLEQPDSLVRLDWQNTWDEEDSYKSRVRLRGKLHLPRISKRLNLLFSTSDENETLGQDERNDANNDLLGLQYSLGELNRSRVDLILDAGTWDLRPGIRYRNQGPISAQVGYRYTQQLEYKDGEGVYSTSELNLDRVLSENSLLRWGNQIIYGQETDGVEWQTQLSLDRRARAQHKKHQLVIGYFGAVNGVTDPNYVKNYAIGMVFRRQVYRPYLFVELVPSYNLRRDTVDENRSTAWNVVLRFEVVFQKDLMSRWRTAYENSVAESVDAVGPEQVGVNLR